MAKLTLSDISSGYLSGTTYTANNTAIETAVENTLSRDGTAPNQMGAVLDMNSYAINNLPNAVANQSPVTLAQAAALVDITAATQASVGALLWPRTAAEISAAVTPTNYYYEPGNVLRYGTNTTPGTTDMTTVISDALSANDAIYIPNGTYLITSTISITSDKEIVGESSKHTILTCSSGVTGAVLSIDPDSGGASIRHLKISKLRFTVTSGTPDNFIAVAASTTYVSTGLNFDDLYFDSLGGNVDRAHVEVEDCWDSVFYRFSHRGTATIAAVYLNSTGSAGGCNGVTVSNVYTSMSSTPYGVLVAGAVGASISQRVRVVDSTLQGHTIGILMADVYGAEVSSCYYESNTTDVQFGDKSKLTIDSRTPTDRSCRGGTNIGGFHNGSGTAIRFDAGVNQYAINPNLTTHSGTWFDIGKVGGVHIMAGGDPSQGELKDNITFNASAHTSTEVLITECGRGDGALQLATTPTQYVLDDLGNSYPVEPPISTIADADATPNVSGGSKIFKTANTGSTTITDFDTARTGQSITVIIGDVNTTIDFTSSGLKGNTGGDWSPTTGDHMTCVYDGTDWYCDISDNTA